MVCSSKPCHYTFFKGSVPHLFLNTLSHLIASIRTCVFRTHFKDWWWNLRPSAILAKGSILDAWLGPASTFLQSNGYTYPIDDIILISSLHLKFRSFFCLIISLPLQQCHILLYVFFLTWNANLSVWSEFFR